MPAVLEPSVPESYQQNPPLKIPAPTIQAVARSLKCYAAHSEGRYPTRQTLPWQTTIQTFLKSIQNPEQLALTTPTKQQLVELADALAGGIYILRAREHGADIDYNGDKIQAGDNNELLSIRHLDGRIESLDGKLNIKVIKP
ncbi:MAG: hypothetical protein JKX85_08250 [Phycisphaeraceae bacterium]|nr:hypothetical protein [Phycisphaeraceae bacterium]